MIQPQQLLKILTIRCEEASVLTSRELDEHLALADRLALRGHTLVCRSCRRLRRQLLFLRDALNRRAAALQDSDTGQGQNTLSPEAQGANRVGAHAGGQRSTPQWRGRLILPIDRLNVHVEHPLPAVIGVANQPLALGVDHEIEQLQRDHADQDRAIIGKLGNLDDAIAFLNCQPRRPINAERDRASGCLRVQFAAVATRAGRSSAWASKDTLHLCRLAHLRPRPDAPVRR